MALGDKGWIGALQREEDATTGAPGYAAAHSATTTVHYYDAKGRPSIDLTTIDGKYFYTYTAYDSSNRVSQMRHYWRPAGQEEPNQSPYVWQDFGYSYTYDTKSYLLSIQDTATPARTWWQADSTAGYDYLDRPILVKKGSNWTQRTYRPTDGVLTAIKTGPTAGSTAIQNLSFNYDGLGNLRSRSGSGGTETLAYDSLNRLTSSKQGAITYFDNGNIKKKADIAGTPAPADFTYDPTHPHAVASAFGYALGYDANGNLTSRTKTGESWSFRYAGFDKPRWMAKTVGSTTVGSEFLYNANRSRTVQLEFDQMSGGVPSRYVRKRVYGLGSTLEANYDNTAASGTPVWALKKVRIYVPGADGVIGSREFDPAAPIGSQEKAFIYHYDHLGSIESITPFVPAGSGLAADSTGKPGRFSEDAWGQRRNPLTWSGAPTTTDDGGADSLTPRGFTGHEMLDDLGLVHMNGRIYDPLLGRFQSADVIVQAPQNLQAYNRYSYVFNNPLSFTDPSGFETIADYEKRLKELHEQKTAGWKAAREGGVLSSLKWMFSKENRSLGNQIEKNEGAINDIQSHASAITDLTGNQVDARKLDDVDPTYKLQEAGLRFFKYVPFASVGGKLVSGQHKGAVKDAAIQGALLYGFTKLAGPGNSSASTATAELTENAAARVAAKVDLDASEKLGGHLLAKHVGKTDTELMSRALTDPMTNVASSFFNRTTADTAVGQAIEANAGRISTWMSEKATRLTIENTTEAAVGRVVTSEGAAITSQSSRVVLEKNAAAANGYIIKTAFPF